MAMDLTEPIPALVMTPTRLLRLAMLVAASGVAALLVAVGVLVWTYSGLRPDSQQQTVPADMSSKPVAAAPAQALAPAPVPAPVAAPPAPAPAAAPAAGANAEILRNPAMAAIAPTAATGSSSTPVSTSGSGSGIPTVRLPGSSVPTVDWNAAGQSLGLQNVNLPALLWASGAGGGGGVPTGAIIGSATAIGTSVGNNAFDLLNTLILANSGFYGGSADDRAFPASACRVLDRWPQLSPRCRRWACPSCLPACRHRGSECRNCRRCRRSVRRRSACPSCPGSGSVCPAHRSGSDSELPTPRRARAG